MGKGDPGLVVPLGRDDRNQWRPIIQPSTMTDFVLPNQQGIYFSPLFPVQGFGVLDRPANRAIFRRFVVAAAINLDLLTRPASLRLLEQLKLRSDQPDWELGRNEVAGRISPANQISAELTGRPSSTYCLEISVGAGGGAPTPLVITWGAWAIPEPVMLPPTGDEIRW